MMLSNWTLDKIHLTKGLLGDLKIVIALKE